jgi:predicted nuclease of restriction endonuclease-like (RecB) superfamily
VSKSRNKNLPAPTEAAVPGYEKVLGGVVQLLEHARRASARAVNAVMTATYWDIGRRIVEFEQGGKDRSQYGAKLLERLSADLIGRFGRGFSVINLRQMRRFYVFWPSGQIRQTLSVEFTETPAALEKGQTAPVELPIFQTPSGKSSEIPPTLERGEKRQTASVEFPIIQTRSEESEIAFDDLARRFPLPWSHYVMLLKVTKTDARAFYEAEALRNGWTVRQLERQITTLFYERALASRNKSTMLKKGAIPKPGEVLSPEEEFKDPFVLEFLGLKDEYSESDLEEALIRELETFLLELGGDFTFVGRQKRLRIGDDWFRIDLLFFHRKLRSLVVIDLKLGKFTHADAGQMHLYLNYAQEHWTNDGENPPVGVILCTQKDAAVVHYALENLPNKVLAAEYRTTLPDEKTLAAELETKRRILEGRRKPGKGGRS